MRRHLSKRDELHHRAASHKTAAIAQLKDAVTVEERHALMRQIIQADRLHDEARAHDGSWQCSFCKQTNPKGKHISVPVAGVLAERGQAKRADDDPERDEGEFVALPPLVKDYPTTHRPYLYLCHECGIACGVVTEKELATGRREDDLTN